MEGSGDHPPCSPEGKEMLVQPSSPWDQSSVLLYLAHVRKRRSWTTETFLPSSKAFAGRGSSQGMIRWEKTSRRAPLVCQEVGRTALPTPPALSCCPLPFSTTVQRRNPSKVRIHTWVQRK